MSFKRRLKPDPEFSSSSIADLVFLLLIFFMLTSSFVTQAGVKVDLPNSDSQKPSEGSNTITITAEGSYYWNKDEVAKDSEEQEDKEEAIKLKIQEVLEDEDEKNNVITLQVDKAVNHGQTMVVFAEVAGLGGSIVIKTERE